MRLAAALALSILTLTVLAPAPADATGGRVSVGKPGQSDDRRGDPKHGHGRRQGHHQQTIVIVPQTVFVSPGRCWQAGYWTYQWVPQTYATNTWVPSRWSPEGAWIEGHYTPTWYSSGYYHPLWVEGYWARC